MLENALFRVDFVFENQISSEFPSATFDCRRVGCFGALKQANDDRYDRMDTMVYQAPAPLFLPRGYGYDWDEFLFLGLRGVTQES